MTVVAYNAAVYAAGELGLTARALEIFEEMKVRNSLCMERGMFMCFVDNGVNTRV